MKAASLALVCVAFLVVLVGGDEGVVVGSGESHSEAMGEYDPDDGEDALSERTAAEIPCEVCTSVNPDAVVSETDRTCADLRIDAANFTFGTGECKIAQAEAAQFCGCEIPSREEICWLCGSGGVLETIDGYVDYLGTNMTCLRALLGAAEIQTPGGAKCATIQDSANDAGCCGGEAPPVDGGTGDEGEEEEKDRFEELEEKAQDFFGLEEDDEDSGGVVSTVEDVVVGILLGSVALAVVMALILVVVIIRQSVRRY